MTSVRVERYVDCPFSAAIELAGHARLPLATLVECSAGTTQDVTDGTRSHDALLIAWHPRVRKILPDFRGVVTVRPRGRGVSMRFYGQYAPPFGPLGRAFDAIAGREIARFTMARFAQALGRDIEAQYRRERSAAAAS